MKIIDTSVDLARLYLTSLPDFLADVQVKGTFSCLGNRLTSLKKFSAYSRWGLLV